MLIKHFSRWLCFPHLDSYHRISSERVPTVSWIHLTSYPTGWKVNLWICSSQTLKLIFHLNLVPKCKKRKALGPLIYTPENLIWNSFRLFFLPTPSTKMEQAECSETSAHKIQLSGIHPIERIQLSEHSESLKSPTYLK